MRSAIRLAVAGLVLIAQFCLAQSPSCSQKTIHRNAARVEVARKVLLSLPIGDGLQTDVSPQARQAIASMKAKLESFVVSYMRCAPLDLHAKDVEKNLSVQGHAVAVEDGHLTLDQLPKGRFNYGYQLGFHAKAWGQNPRLIGIVADFQIECGEDASLFIFEANNGFWKEAIAWTGKQYKTIAGGFGSFDYGISPPDKDGQWFVVTKYIDPWCSSTWSVIHYAVLRPSQQSPAPRVLFTGSDDIWWGNDDEGSLKMGADNFDL